MFVIGIDWSTNEFGVCVRRAILLRDIICCLILQMTDVNKSIFFISFSKYSGYGLFGKLLAQKHF